MLLRKYEMPWRRAYEAYAGLAWALASLFFVFATVRSGMPWPVAAALAVVCLVLALHRSLQALGVLTVRASLCGRAMAFIAPAALRKLCADPNQVFLGFGFEWQPVHSQRLYELAKVDFRDLMVAPSLLRFLGHEVDPQPDDEIGLPYIHGVEAKERMLYRPLVNFEGGTCIAGTTQSGKGVALSVLISQAVYRGDRKLPRQVDSSKVEFPPRADARDSALAAGFPARRAA